MATPSTALQGTAVLAAQDTLEHDPEWLRERAHDILSRPPYLDEDPNPLAALLDRGVQWLGDRVAEIVGRFLDAVMATGTAGAWAIVGVGCLLLALLVWRLTRGMAIDRRAVEVPGATPARSAASWFAEADAHESSGDLRAALRARYGGIVASLVEAGTIEDVAGRTTRELEAEVAVAAPGIVAGIADVGRRYEHVVYGGRAASSEDLRAAADVSAGLRAVRS